MLRERSPFPAPPTHPITPPDPNDDDAGDPVDSLESLQRNRLKTASRNLRDPTCDPNRRDDGAGRRSTNSPSRAERRHSVTDFGGIESLLWVSNAAELAVDLPNHPHHHHHHDGHHHPDPHGSADFTVAAGEEEDITDDCQRVWSCPTGCTEPAASYGGRRDHTPGGCYDVVTSQPYSQGASHHHLHPHTSPATTEVMMAMKTGVWEGVRGLDKQMKGVCRSLRVLCKDLRVFAGRDGCGEDHSGGGVIMSAGKLGSSATTPDGSSLLLWPDSRSTDGEEYYDCISPEPEKRAPSNSRNDGRNLPSSPRFLSADQMIPHCRTKHTPSPPQPSRLQTPDMKVLTRFAKRSAAGCKDLTSYPKDLPEHRRPPSPPPSHDDDDPHPNQQQQQQMHPPSRQHHHRSASMKGKGLTHGAALKPGERDTTGVHHRAAASWDFKLNNTRSLPSLRTLQAPGSTQDPCSATLEGWWSDSERGSLFSNGSSGRLKGSGQDGGVEVDQDSRGGEGGGGGGGGVTTWGGGVVLDGAWRRLREVEEQMEVLKTLWGHHKTRLHDTLTDQEKDAGRVRRLEQSSQRGRQMVSSLRTERRQLHQQMEHKEGEMTLALRHHKNEAAFLRHKVLGFLEEKKAALTGEEKCEGRLKSMMETLLSLYLDRERFLALDLAKQNKINELKLLVVRQQLAMEELKEHNAELNQAFNTLMQFLPEQGKSPLHHHPRGSPSPPIPWAGLRACPGACGRGCSVRGMGLSDVLNCERSLYLPGHSTSPELAAVTVYGIGGERSALTSPPEEVFDASRHFCHADGDHNSHYHPYTAAATTTISCVVSTTTGGGVGGGMDTASSAQAAEKLLQELTLHGPGSADFTLSDLPS
ncbi:hypothetical protein ACOMHN_019476 [Nucella lapillus]